MKFIVMAVGSAVLVGGFLSLVVSSIIKSSQTKGTRNGYGASPDASTARTESYRSNQDGEREVAFSPVNL
ncbi:MAG TPA: hypothetical protein VGM18_00245 [Candidatus Sulfotelmatobacter sp.]